MGAMTARKRHGGERTRVISDIFGSDRLDERFNQLLDDLDPTLRLYVYRLECETLVRPALIKGYTFRDLTDVLRDEHGGGRFYVMFRRGEKLVLTGAIDIAPPPTRRY